MAICAVLAIWGQSIAHAQPPWRFILPEQRRTDIRTPSQMPTARLPKIPAPATVSAPRPDLEEWKLSLDEAIRIGLANSEVVRVLTGTSAASSGRTIYDPAITNTQIDRARARFDPSLSVQNGFGRRETPVGLFDPGDSSRALIDGSPVQDYDMLGSLSKTTATGGTASMNVRANPSRDMRDISPLNPEVRSSADINFTQPIFQGGGTRANLAPLVIAQIDTERSFYQFKDSVQQLVTGVIAGYWAVVFARTDVWVRQQQVEQGLGAFGRAEARLNAGMGDLAEVSQARSALANFRANLITSEAGLLQREAALRNILGISPSDSTRIVPVTPPSSEQLQVDWDEIVALAEMHRPDLIELKLILEADEERLEQAANLAMPRVDAVATYRWNGLEGREPDGSYLASRPGQFADWEMGLNVSVPLGLRETRADLRRQELTIMRDRANLHQGLHSATHDLATRYRNLSQFFAQYQAFQETRTAARINLDVQWATNQSGLSIFLNVLEAITTWGNAVSAEAQALAQYNTEFANLEQQMGTILETHGVRFQQRPYCSLGPLGRTAADRTYPKGTQPGPNADLYPVTDEPAENVFDLNDPVPARRERIVPPPVAEPIQ